MPLLLDKILTLLAMPLGLAVGLALLALAALALDRRRTATGLLGLAIAWLWGCSMPVASSALLTSLTDRHPFQRVEELPAADAIVLLGNTTPNPRHPAYPYPRDADRIWYAARLYRAGKAPLIVVSAGNVWRGSGRQSAAEAARVLLNAFGVPSDAIVLEDRSRNTRQNALFTAEIAADRGIRRMLLATSASHMPRAQAAFARAGLDVIPAASGYPLRRARPWILGILPSAGALGGSTIALREYLGLLVYRLRGWV